MSAPDNLARFVEAQAAIYVQALAELRAGRKTTHWMWFVFPQLKGLGRSHAAEFYGIADLEEARAYLAHPLLGPRLVECAEALLAVPSGSAADILGTPDDLKLRSCATLFARAAGPTSVFERVLRRFFEGRPDPRTVEALDFGTGCASRSTSASASRGPEMPTTTPPPTAS